MQTILHMIPTLEGGGAERQLSFLALQHANMGFMVHIGIRRGGVNVDYLNHKNIKIYYLGDYSGINPIFFLKILFLVRKTKPDIIQTWLTQMDILGGINAIIFRIPWVLSERSSGKSIKTYSILEKFKKILGNYSACIIANSMNGASHWKSIFPMKRVICIPNAIDFDGILKYESIPINYGDIQKKIILVVGRLNLHKGILTVINSISLIRNRNDYRVLIIGEGPLKKYLVDLIREVDLSNRIEVLNYDKDWWKYLFKASIFISMSEFEGQPNALLEAIVAGTPLILSSIEEHHELVDINDAIFIKDKNIISLSNSIINILNNKNSCSDKLNITFNKISQFNFQNIASSYLTIYSELISRKN